MNRGDIVIVPFPFQDKPGEKIRPAVVVQSDVENRRLANTILAMITGNLDDFGATNDRARRSDQSRRGRFRADRPLTRQMP